MKKNISKLKIFGGDYIDELDRRILSNKILWIFMVFFMLIIIMLSIGFFHLKDRISLRAELPLTTFTERQTLEVGYDRANDMYFELWGFYLANQAGNFKKETIESQLEEIKKRLRPDVYNKYNKVFKKFVKLIRDNRVDMSFIGYKAAVSSKNNGHTASVKVNGIANILVGSTQRPPKECSIDVGFIMLGGRPYITSFRTDCIQEDQKEGNQNKKITKGNS